MKKLVLILLASFVAFSAGATILKNGAEADQKRIDQIWKAIKKIKDYPLLLCTAMDCKDGKLTEHA